MEKYRIESIQKATVNGRKVKLFKAFGYNEAQSAYVFRGQYEAPEKTPNGKLAEFIDN